MAREVRRESQRTLERIPMGLIEWDVRNSHRRDLALSGERDRFARVQILAVLPPDERPVQKWNSNPHAPDGGSAGGAEDDGAFFLLPYWMGRYHRWVR